MNCMIAKPSLRFQLSIPFVIILIILALALSLLSYQSAKSVVIKLSDNWLEEKSVNISQAIEAHFIGIDLALDSAKPRRRLLSDTIKNKIDLFHRRFWRHSSQNSDYKVTHFINNDGHAYSFEYIDDQNSKAWRYNADVNLLTEYTLQRDNTGEIKASESIAQNTIRQPISMIKSADYDGARGQVMLYWDNQLNILKALYAKKVVDREGLEQGLIGIEIPLNNLNLIFDNANLINQSATAVLFEYDTGAVIASSINIPMEDNIDESGMPIIAEKHESLVIRSLYELLATTKTEENPSLSSSASTIESTKKTHYIKQSLRIGDTREWVLIVSQPVNYFLGPLSDNLLRNLFISILGAILCGLLGYTIANSASRDLRKLATAAKKIGDGELDTPIDIYRDDEVGQLAEQFRQMEIDLRSDKLTGLYSRDAFEKVVNRRIEKFQQQNEYMGFSILFLDINSFKHINDTMGHQVGDDIIKLAADKLTALCNDGDLLARYAGDEFVILVEHANDKRRLPRMISGIESIQKTARDDSNIDVKILDRIDFSLAVGVSHFPEDGHTAAILVEVADRNMYSDKRRIKRKNQPKF